MLNILHKKAAMFGLDARIALAIFGALSVISGAALYSAIKQAKATALLTDLREIGKAWEAYYLDTGVKLPRANSDSSNSFFNRFKMQNLVENPDIKGWSGPYLSYEYFNDPVDQRLTDGKSSIYTFALNDKDWGGSYENGFCKSGDNCFVWSYMFINNSYSVPSIQKAVDEIVDGGDGGNKGNLRWSDNNVNIILKIAPIKNPL